MSPPLHTKRYCPSCRENHTKRLDVIWHGDSVDEKRECKDCGIEFTNTFEFINQKVTDQ